MTFNKFDSVLNIYQTALIYDTKKVNLAILESQYKSNYQLNELLNQQLIANKINKEILSNQIAEIKSKEEQNFYKNLGFNNNEIL